VCLTGVRDGKVVLASKKLSSTELSITPNWYVPSCNMPSNVVKGSELCRTARKEMKVAE
jgi:hypothetical protein